MKGGRLAVFAAALAAAGAAVWLAGLEREAPEAELLFPALTLDELNAVNRIEITERGGPSPSPLGIYLDDDGEWRVAAHHDHPADVLKVRKLLSGIKDAEKIERKTSLPEHYATLGVDDPREAGGNGVLLEFHTPEASHELILGDTSRQISGGRYVRKPDEAETWLINAALALPAGVSEWLDVEIMHLEPDQISTVRLTPAGGGGAFTVARDKNKRLTVADVPEGKALKDQYKLRQIVAVAEYMKFKNVFPRDNDRVELSEEFVTAEFKTQDGMTVTVEAYKDESDGVYLKLDADGISPSAESLKRRLSKWLYEVSPNVYKDLDRKLKDFLKDAS